MAEVFFVCWEKKQPKQHPKLSFVSRESEGIGVVNDPLIRLYSLELQLFNEKRSFTRNRQSEISAPRKNCRNLYADPRKTGFRPILKEQEFKKYYLCLLEIYRQRYLYLVSLVKGQRSHCTVYTYVYIYIYSPFTNDRIPCILSLLELFSFILYGNDNEYQFFNDRWSMALM